MLRYVEGDATRPTGPGAKLIVHVVNDEGRWGSGFVVAVSRRWPGPEQAYRTWHRTGAHTDTGGRAVTFALGAVQAVPVADDLTVVNLLGQHGIRRGRGGRPPVRYDAIRTGLAAVRELAAAAGASVHAPRLGAGLAGGDWATVEGLLVDELASRGVPVTVYDLPGTAASATAAAASTMRMAVVGSTRFANPDGLAIARQVIDDKIRSHRPRVVISGGAVGVDTLAREVAARHGYTVDNGRLVEHLPGNRVPDGCRIQDMAIATDCTHLLAVRCAAATGCHSDAIADRAEQLGRVVRRVIVPAA